MEGKTTREMCVMVSFSCFAKKRGGEGETVLNRDTYNVIYYRICINTRKNWERTAVGHFNWEQSTCLICYTWGTDD